MNSSGLSRFHYITRVARPFERFSKARKEELGGWGLLLTKEVFHSSREVRTRFENVQFAKKILNTHFVPDCCRSPNHYATLDQDMPFYTQTWTCAWPSYQRYKNGFYNIASRATQSNSVYVSVLQISTEHADGELWREHGVSKSL